MTADYVVSWLCIQEAKRVALTLWADVADGIARPEWASRAAIRSGRGGDGPWNMASSPHVGKGGGRGVFMRQQEAVLKGHRLLLMRDVSFLVLPGEYERERDDGLTAFHVPRTMAGMPTVSSDVPVAAA